MLVCMSLRATAVSWLAALALALLTACDPAAQTEAGKTCASDDDCDKLVCIAKAQAAPEDLAALPLICDQARDARAPHEACESAKQCATGVCLLAGACARPCATEAQCE